MAEEPAGRHYFRAGDEVSRTEFAKESEGRAYVHRALQADAGKLRTLAQKVLKEAQEHQKKEQFVAARDSFAYAWLLSAAAESYGYGRDQVQVVALAGIQEVNAKLFNSWKKAEPKLEKKLDLVIRNKSLMDALVEVAKAADLPVKLVEGSMEDACAVTWRKTLHVTYLDLRGATVAQALNWMLHPVRMTWWMSKGSPVIGTCRRSGVDSAWVYDVSAIALPLADEMKDLKDHNKRVEAMKKSAGDFLAAVRGHLGVTDDAVQWFAPGQVVVFGGKKTHAAATKLFAGLADTKAQPARVPAEVHTLTTKRGGARKDLTAKRLDGAETARVFLAMRDYSWKLLAEAAAGNLDTEALTELQVAWSNPQAKQLLKEGHSWVPLRSVWAIAEAARALPAEGKASPLSRSAGRMRQLWPVKVAFPATPEPSEVAALAQVVQTLAREADADALAALEKSPDDVSAFFRVLYAALARPGDEAFAVKARTLLAGGKNQQLADAHTMAAALLSPAGQADGKALSALARKGVGGSDMVALTAVACRRTGGETWNTFRGEAKDLLGRQPLPGSVVVLVNRLARSHLPVTVARR